MSRTAREGSVRSRDLLFVLAVAACGAPGLLFGSRGVPDPLATLVWVAILAPSGGAACGARSIRLWPLAPVVPIAWVLWVAFADALSERDLPSLAWVVLPIAGLFGLGYAHAPRDAEGAWRRSGSLLLVSALLAALPLAGLVLREAWPPRIAAFVLDLSPATLAAECAGVDWMRQPAIYDGSSTVDIDPALRSPFDPRLAGGVAFVVGCVLAVVRARARNARASATAT